VALIGREQDAGVYRLVGDKYEELVATVGEVQTSRAFIDYKIEFILGGGQSGYRIRKGNPFLCPPIRQVRPRSCGLPGRVAAPRDQDIAAPSPHLLGSVIFNGLTVRVLSHDRSKS
jgi:hypothetical protein